MPPWDASGGKGPRPLTPPGGNNSPPDPLSAAPAPERTSVAPGVQEPGPILRVNRLSAVKTGYGWENGSEKIFNGLKRRLCASFFLTPFKFLWTTLPGNCFPG